MRAKPQTKCLRLRAKAAYLQKCAVGPFPKCCQNQEGAWFFNTITFQEVNLDKSPSRPGLVHANLQNDTLAFHLNKRNNLISIPGGEIGQIGGPSGKILRVRSGSVDSRMKKLQGSSSNRATARLEFSDLGGAARQRPAQPFCPQGAD